MRRARMGELSILCLVSAALLHGLWIGAFGLGSSPSSPAAVREAKRLWIQAQTSVNENLDWLAAEHPTAAAETRDDWRHQLLTRDATGDLSRAAMAARLAMRKARTPDESYQASLWLALIECDRGHHQTEAQLVRQLLQHRTGKPAPLLKVEEPASLAGTWVEYEGTRGEEEVEPAPPRRGSMPERTTCQGVRETTSERFWDLTDRIGGYTSLRR